MTPHDLGVLVAVLTTASALTALVSWSPPARPFFAPFAVALLVAALLVAGLSSATTGSQALTGALALAAGVTAVAGGSPVTTLLFAAVDRDRGDAPAVAEPGVLRGGVWIGALERSAVFVSVAAGWPEGVALALAVKGLGRYGELRHPGAAERFIIGTFASVLWAVACAGPVMLTR